MWTLVLLTALLGHLGQPTSPGAPNPRLALVADLRAIGAMSLEKGGYRFFDRQEALIFRVTLINQSTEPIKIQKGFERTLLLSVTRVDDPEPQGAATELGRVHLPGGAAQNVTLAPNESVTRVVSVRKAGGFEPGIYVVRLDLTTLGHALVERESRPTAGGLPVGGEKPLIIARSATRSEWISGRARLAEALQAENSIAAAQSVYQDLVKSAPESPAGALGLARMAITAKRFDEAAIWLEKVVGPQTPLDDPIWDSLINASLRGGSEDRLWSVLDRYMARPLAEKKVRVVRGLIGAR
jgi:hypothetical protein